MFELVFGYHRIFEDVYSIDFNNIVEIVTVFLVFHHFVSVQIRRSTLNVSISILIMYIFYKLYEFSIKFLEDDVDSFMWFYQTTSF